MVEDEAVVALDIQKRLKKLGYEAPIITHSGEEAIKQVEKIKPNLVLMDIILKGKMDGIQAAKQIQRNFHIPVIYLTAYADKKTLRRAKMTEPLGYILKPFEDRDLHVAIEIALYKHTMEQKLKESEEKYRSLVENAYDIIITFSPIGKIMSTNPIAEKLTEWPNAYWIGKHFSLIIHPDDSPVILNNFQALLRNHQPSPFDVRFRIKSGEYKSFELVTIPQIQHEKVIGFLGIARDITERKLIEKTKNDLEKRRKDFIEAVAHELRTPLTSIKGFSEILHTRIDNLPQEHQERCFMSIDRNISKLEFLINDISILAKLDRGALELTKKAENFGSFLRNLIKSYEILFKYQIECHFCDEIFIHVEMDKDRIQQVLDNVINNAVKHTPEDTRKIVLTTKICLKVVQVEISDNGAGIEPHNLERIFEPFISMPTKYGAKGTGIGLNLCKLILEKHGGTITAHSDGLDRGATFIIELPHLEPNN